MMKIVALAGGVGGAKLAQGLAAILKSDELTLIVNTGDDFKYLGLHISPDVDTVCYTLAGIANQLNGWGIENDTFTTYDALSRLGGPDWFKLGDLDLATHLKRTHLISEGKTLSEVTGIICKELNIQHFVLPMSNDPVSTWVDTEEFGLLPFQEYFVKHRTIPSVKAFYFKGIENASATKEVIRSISESNAVIFCPSNPFVSIDPIINLNGVRELIDKKLVLCVSPIIDGNAVKGPLAKMFVELGLKPTPYAVAEHYKDLVDLLIVDNLDSRTEFSKSPSSIIIYETDILIPDKPNRIRLASEIVDILTKYLSKE